MSSGWSWYIIVITLANIAGCWWLLWHFSRKRQSEKPQETPAQTGEPEDTGHVWDGDLREYNNPLPRWWLGLFYITVVFALVYLALYPGLGSFAGVLDWDQQGQYRNEVLRVESQYAEIYDRYAAMDVAALAADEDGLRTGHRLFINNCSTCHGSDARGAPGFPNLRDGEWLYGGSPEAIKQSIANGRSGTMPPWEAALGGDQGVKQVTAYVLKLAGRRHDTGLAADGEAKYKMFCTACHGAEGKGNPLLGAPDLTNDVWLYGGDDATIAESIAGGRRGSMPAHRELLGEDKVHVLAAYVYSLNGQIDD